MTDKRYIVPEGMLQAGRAVYSGYVTAEVGARRILEAALRWLAENPQHPTDYEFGEIVNACRDSIGAEAWEKGTEWMRAGMLCHEWQRRMFDAPEPEMIGNEEIGRFCGRYQRIDDAVREAYLRGQQSHKKEEFQFGATGFEPITGHRPNSQVDKDGGVIGVDYYRRTPDGGYAKMDGPVDVTPEPEVPEETKDFSAWVDVNYPNDPRNPELKTLFGTAYRRGQRSKETAK